MQAIQELSSEKTLATLTVTFRKRIQNNHVSKIMTMERTDISPAVYSLLQNSQTTTASVERGLSLLQKLLAKDRNFQVENVK